MVYLTGVQKNKQSRQFLAALHCNWLTIYLLLFLNRCVAAAQVHQSEQVEQSVVVGVEIAVFAL